MRKAEIKLNGVTAGRLTQMKQAKPAWLQGTNNTHTILAVGALMIREI
jgi:hypothetical protein